MEPKNYIKSEGLDKLINFNKGSDSERGVFDAVNGKLTKPIPPPYK